MSHIKLEGADFYKYSWALTLKKKIETVRHSRKLTPGGCRKLRRGSWRISNTGLKRTLPGACLRVCMGRCVVF